MKNIVYPAIYKHFKGKYYAVMGVSNPVETSIVNFNGKCFKVKNSEDEEIFEIILTDNGSFYHDKSNEQNIVVIYKTLYDDSIPYVRPLDMFLSQVDKDKYPNCLQMYRFELVKY